MPKPSTYACRPAIVRQVNPGSDGNDVNYIFLSFVLASLPVGAQSVS
jgi:hypothetical protein